MATDTDGADVILLDFFFKDWTRTPELETTMLKKKTKQTNKTLSSINGRLHYIVEKYLKLIIKTIQTEVSCKGI